MQRDFFESGADDLHRILEAFGNDIRLQLSQSLDILVDGDQLLCSGGGSEQLLYSRPDEKHDLTREVVEMEKVLGELCVVSRQWRSSFSKMSLYYQMATFWDVTLN